MGCSPIWSQETSKEPPKPSSSKDFYVPIGSSVELPCGEGVDKGLEWKRNGSVVVSGPVLKLHNTSLEDGGIYTCYGSNENPIESYHLQLGYAPSTPEVKCWAPRYPLNAVCTWTLTPDPILPTHYIATYWYVEDDLPAVRLCLRQSEQDKQCVVEIPDAASHIPILLNITAVNALGTTTHTLSLDIAELVKPDPPVNLKATLLSGQKVQVQWDPPPTWPDPVNFLLSYQVHFYWGKHNLANILGPYESTSMIRGGLVAGRTYYIRVSAKDFLGNGQSSEWSDPVNITAI
ncbi:interleukin-27 subunit beta isoform X2 [Hoplias malabaricus]|uniref:interleukin-27 subunit beta isoform X2 n=1 Tax=Hoplias malabaricus TaxID=27720 RepID=UPI00346278D8